MGSEDQGELRGWGRIEKAGTAGTRRLPNGQYIPTPLVHRSNPNFRSEFDKLPPEIKAQAVERHRLLERNPGALILDLRSPLDDIWRVEVGHGYRAVGTMPDEGVIIWFAIRPHEAYGRLMDDLRAEQA